MVSLRSQLSTAAVAALLSLAGCDRAPADIGRCDDCDSSLRSETVDNSALAQFVNTVDPEFDFTVVGSTPGDGYTVYLLNMTSQRWRTEEEVTPNLWNHWLTIVVPDVLLTDKAHLIITGGSMSATPPDGDDLALFGPIALATGTPVAVLSQVPGQPLTAPDRPEPMREDDLVAYTWKKAMETGDPTWAAYLPMTKAAVRGMDATESFLGDALGTSPSGFIVTGFSKRGATAWLTAAVDPRVEAVVPGVFNVLNLSQHVEDQFENYGSYAEAADDYVDEEVLQEIRSPEGAFLTSIVDPLAYAEALTMPQYILSATGDEFFVPDGSQLFIDELPGEATQRIVPNEGHSLEENLEVNLSALVAWYQAVLLDIPRPQISEELQGDGTLHVETDQAPLAALLWTATNSDTRDFRFDTIGASWVPTPLEPNEDGSYDVEVPEPSDGYTAYVVEFAYPGAADFPQRYTTSTHVTPDTRPFSLEQDVGDPRRRGYWRHQVLGAWFDLDFGYSADALEAMLPIQVREETLTTLDELLVALVGSGNPERRAVATCTAARLNIESGELGWYSRFTPSTYVWEQIQASQSEAPRDAARTCRKLNRL